MPPKTQDGPRDLKSHIPKCFVAVVGRLFASVVRFVSRRPFRNFCWSKQAASVVLAIGAVVANYDVPW